MTRHYSVWATFDGEKALEAAQRTAVAEGSPHFQLHCTILGGVEHLERDEFIRVVEKALENTIEFDVTLPPAVATGNSRFECVFLALGHDKQAAHALHQVHGALKKAVFDAYRRAPPPGAFKPHVSLAYGEWPTEKKAQVAEALKEHMDALALRTIRVRELVLASTPLDKHPATHWEVFHHVPLIRKK